MLYLYTVMMFAWDMDPDTHAYFREYLDVFINKRKISKDLMEFVRDTRSRAISAHIRPGHDTESIFNELRISLPGPLAEGGQPARAPRRSPLLPLPTMIALARASSFKGASRLPALAKHLIGTQTPTSSPTRRVRASS